MLELTNYEKGIIIDLFLKHALHENYVDSEGFDNQRFMRQNTIWIRDASFAKKHKRIRSIQSLIQKRVITEHSIWGFQFKIKPEFKRQVYDLLDAENIELVEQLSALWLEVRDNETTEK